MSCACIVSQPWRPLSFSHFIIQEVENIIMEMSQKKKIWNSSVFAESVFLQIAVPHDMSYSSDSREREENLVPCKTILVRE